MSNVATQVLDHFVGQVGAQAATWLQSCVHCGECAEACHFYEVTKHPRYTPTWKLEPFARAYRARKAPFAGVRKALGLAREPDEAELREWQELLYDSCTMCGRCSMVCPMGIDIASLVGLARKSMAANGIGPEDLFAIAEKSKEVGSPLGVTPEKLEDRIDWLSDEHEVDIPLNKETAEVLLTVSSIETMKYPQSIVAMAKVLNHAEIDWTFSTKGYEATNFGMLAGKADVAKVMIERIVAAAEAVGAKTVIIPECGHAYGALRWTGSTILGRPLPFEVFHITEYLAMLKREGRLKLKPMGDAITYHDPCQISRRGGATAAAREVLDGFATGFREMSPTGNANWCCGGGGGVAAIERATPLRHKVFEIKMKQVEDVDADMMISACSNCRQTLDGGKEHYKWDREIGSLIEIVADHLVEA